MRNLLLAFLGIMLFGLSIGCGAGTENSEAASKEDELNSKFNTCISNCMSQDMRNWRNCVQSCWDAEEINSGSDDSNDDNDFGDDSDSSSGSSTTSGTSGTSGVSCSVSMSSNGTAYAAKCSGGECSCKKNGTQVSKCRHQSNTCGSTVSNSKVKLVCCQF